jgi:hypothetical protein
MRLRLGPEDCCEAVLLAQCLLLELVSQSSVDDDENLLLERLRLMRLVSCTFWCDCCETLLLVRLRFSGA